jgi:hypothetical protein
VRTGSRPSGEPVYTCDRGGLHGWHGPVVPGSVAMGSPRNLSTYESKRVLMTTDVGRTLASGGLSPIRIVGMF